MRIVNRNPLVFSALVATFLAVPALATSSPDPTGVYFSLNKTKVRVAKLGGDKASAFNDLTVRSDGTWRCVDDNEWGYTYSGTWAPLKGKKYTWTFDAAGRATLERMGDNWAGAYGYDVTTRVGTVKTKAKMRGVDSLKVVIKASFTMDVEGRSRRGKLKILGNYLRE